jgi:hypothetical protein
MSYSTYTAPNNYPNTPKNENLYAVGFVPPYGIKLSSSYKLNEEEEVIHFLREHEKGFKKGDSRYVPTI